MVAGPCHVTDNAEGTTHNEMQAPRPPPGMETTKRMNCFGQDCGDKTFWDTPPGPSQVSTSVLSAAEMEKKYGKKKKLFHLPFLPTLKMGFCGMSRMGRGGGERFQAFWFHQHKGSRGALRKRRGPGLGWSDILECLPGFKEAKSLGLIHIHFRLKVKDSQPLLISLSLAELCVQGSLAL